jgi:hypothetical protein
MAGEMKNTCIVEEKVKARDHLEDLSIGGWRL